MYISVEDKAVQNGKHFEYRHRFRTDYTTLRSLSNVNRQIRKEFADVFWRNAAVYILHDDDHMRLPVHFLEDRPSICSRLKSFFITLDWSFVEELHDDAHRHVRTCTYLSNHLDLNVFGVCLFTTLAIAQHP